jgi:hypothetical protein
VVTMSIGSVWRKVVRTLTPPGSRAPLDESYRQPNADPEHQMSGATGGGKIRGTIH